MSFGTPFGAAAAPSGDPISDQKYRPFLEAIKELNSDLGVTGMGWAGLAGLAGWL